MLFGVDGTVGACRSMPLAANWWSSLPFASFSENVLLPDASFPVASKQQRGLLLGRLPINAASVTT